MHWDQVKKGRGGRERSVIFLTEEEASLPFSFPWLEILKEAPLCF